MRKVPLETLAVPVTCASQGVTCLLTPLARVPSPVALEVKLGQTLLGAAQQSPVLFEHAGPLGLVRVLQELFEIADAPGQEARHALEDLGGTAGVRDDLVGTGLR